MVTHGFFSTSSHIAAEFAVPYDYTHKLDSGIALIQSGQHWIIVASPNSTASLEWQQAGLCATRILDQGVEEVATNHGARGAFQHFTAGMPR